MGYVEIFRLDNEGAGWVDLSEATPQELLDLEIGLFQEGALQGVSFPEIVGGLGYNSTNNKTRKENYKWLK